MDKQNHQTNYEDDLLSLKLYCGSNHDDDLDDLLSLKLYCGSKRSRNSYSPPSLLKKHITNHQTLLPQIPSKPFHLDLQTPSQPALQLSSNHPLYYLTRPCSMNNLTIHPPLHPAHVRRNPSPNPSNEDNTITMTPQPLLQLPRDQPLCFVPEPPSLRDNVIVRDPPSHPIHTRGNSSPNPSNEDMTTAQPQLQSIRDQSLYYVLPSLRDNITLCNPPCRKPSPNPNNEAPPFPHNKPLYYVPPSPVPEPSSLSDNTTVNDRPLRSARTCRNPPQNPSSEDNSKTITPPYPWATNRPATIHNLSYLYQNKILTITGMVRCTKCERDFEMEFDLEDKLVQVWDYIRRNKSTMHDRAPDVWMSPALPSCKYCSRDNARPIIAEDKEKINWLFLFLGQWLGCCTLEQLKYFCGRTDRHRTGAKDRVLYLAYLVICKQLVPNGPFDLW